MNVFRRPLALKQLPWCSEKAILSLVTRGALGFWSAFLSWLSASNSMQVKYWMSPWPESSWSLWSWLFWPWSHRQVTVPLYLTTIYFLPSWNSSQERNKTTTILKKQVEILMEALTWWRFVSWKLWGKSLLCTCLIFHNFSLSIHYWPFTLLCIPRKRRD